MNLEEITERLLKLEAKQMAARIALAALVRNSPAAKQNLMLACVKLPDFLLQFSLTEAQIAEVQTSLLEAIQDHEAPAP